MLLLSSSHIPALGSKSVEFPESKQTNPSQQIMKVYFLALLSLGALFVAADEAAFQPEHRDLAVEEESDLAVDEDFDYIENRELSGYEKDEDEEHDEEDDDEDDGDDIGRKGKGKGGGKGKGKGGSVMGSSGGKGGKGKGGRHMVRG